MDLIRMNLDGTDRQVIYNTSEFAAAHNYRDFSNHAIFNGVLFLMLGRIDENGDLFYDSAYYKLDGSMSEPKIDTFFTLSFFADGENIVGCVDYDRENDLRVVGIWDPDKGIVEELSRDSIVSASGYYGTKAHYYVEDGIIIEDSYSEGKKEFINTGHSGNYQLACLPDCIAMYEDDYYEEKIIYFYDWDGNDLGSVNIDYEFDKSIIGFICGETPERIFLTDEFMCLPHYYINKSDLGTGNIEIHTLNMPEDLAVSFEEDEGD